MRRYFFMFALLLVFLTGAIGTARAETAPPTCAGLPMPATEISVNIILGDPQYDKGRTAGDIQRNRDTLVRRWLDEREMELLWEAEHLKIGGYGIGGWVVRSGVEFGSLPYGRSGQTYCPAITAIYVDILYQPLLMVAADVARDRCLNTIIDRQLATHDLQTRQVLESWREKITDDLARYAKELQAAAPVQESARPQALFEVLGEQLQRRINKVYKGTMQHEIVLRSEVLYDPRYMEETMAEHRACIAEANSLVPRARLPAP